MSVELDALVTINGRSVPVGVADDHAMRVRAWYLDAVNHPKWVNYIRESIEDLGFYIGGELQWSHDGSTSDLQRLKMQQRTVVSLNYIQSVANVLIGMERQNRFDTRAVPQGDEDDQSAELMTWLLKFVQDQAEVPDIISEGFADGVIRGMSVFEVGIDDTDEEPGEIFVRKYVPGQDVVWDPYWTSYDLSDREGGARFVMKYRWAYVPDLCASYPEHKNAIRAATTDIDIFRLVDQMTTSGPPSDAFGAVASHPHEALTHNTMFYDPDEQRALVIETWYRDYEPYWLIRDKLTGRSKEVEDADLARRVYQSDPKNLTLTRKERRVIRRSVVLPATYQTLEEGDNPYDNDEGTFPFVAYTANRHGDHILGVVRNLKDPQRVENKRISQALDILAKFGNLRVMAYENTLRDPNAFVDPMDQSTIWLQAGAENREPKYLVPPLAEVTRVLTDLATYLRLSIREISGINTDALGIRADDASGVAIARRQAQAQTIATMYFDNLRRSRKLIGRRLARRIQQTFTTERLIRLTDEHSGRPVIVRLNPIEAKGKSPKEFKTWQATLGPDEPRVLRDVTALKYDISISDTPSTPSMRASSLLALLDIVSKIPALGPVMLDVIVELADIPHRAELLDRAKRLIPPELRGEMPTPAAPGGPAMPPGAPAPAIEPAAPAGMPAAALAPA